MKKLLFTLLAVGYAWVLPAQEGLFGMERKGETVHWSIPDSLLGRDLMLTTTVLKAPARTTPDYTKKYGHPGDLFGPIILRFRKVDERTGRLLNIDFIEIVPRSVYNGATPEDRN